jgi:hypothetical protein
MQVAVGAVVLPVNPLALQGAGDRGDVGHLGSYFLSPRSWSGTFCVLSGIHDWVRGDFAVSSLVSNLTAARRIGAVVPPS